MYEIKTSKYLKERKVLIDGIEATIKPLGAGSQLEFSRVNRRVEALDKKQKAGGLSDAELDRYDELEDRLLALFAESLRDDTPDNSKIKQWLATTPIEVISAAFEEMQAQFAQKDGDGQGTKQEVSEADA